MVEIPKVTEGELVSAGIGALAGLAIGGVAGAAIAGSSTKKSRRRKTRKHKVVRKRVRKHKRKLKFGSKAYRKKYLKHGRKKKHQRQPHTAGRRRDSSHRRIRYTKNNQPYIILSSGKARFISKKSVSSSRKRRGGRY